MKKQLDLIITPIYPPPPFFYTFSNFFFRLSNNWISIIISFQSIELLLLHCLKNYECVINLIILTCKAFIITIKYFKAGIVIRLILCVCLPPSTIFCLAAPTCLRVKRRIQYRHTYEPLIIILHSDENTEMNITFYLLAQNNSSFIY